MSYAITPQSSRFGLSPAGDGSISSYAPPMAIAGGVVACLIWTAREVPLPSIGWAATFLFLAIHQDVSHLRIPNWLTLPGLALALGVAAVAGGSAGLTAALAGAGTALACTFLPFVMRWLGAGDVKACMVLGALWGAENFLGALFWMLLAGGALALVLLLAQGGLIDLFQRWYASVRLTLTSGRINYIAPAEGSTARSGVPFAVAMGLGACAIQLWGTSW
jgi:prepilin peptidase CpaA